MVNSYQLLSVASSSSCSATIWGSLHRIQPYRNKLLCCGSPTCWLLPGACSCMGLSSQLAASFRAHPPALAQGPLLPAVWVFAPPWCSMGRYLLQHGLLCTGCSSLWRDSPALPRVLQGDLEAGAPSSPLPLGLTQLFVPLFPSSLLAWAEGLSCASPHGHFCTPPAPRHTDQRSHYCACFSRRLR